MRSWVLFVAMLGCGGGGQARSPETSAEPQTPEAIELHNRAVPYINRAVEAQREGDWQEARKALSECVSEVGHPECQKRLDDLESRHRF